jgi:hypothetical protein
LEAPPYDNSLVRQSQLWQGRQPKNPYQQSIIARFEKQEENLFTVEKLRMAEE